MQICVATPDFIGPIRNGGVGTAFLGMAEALRNAGHRVSVLYASDYYEEEGYDHWRRHYADQEIDFYSLPKLEKSDLMLADIARSIGVYEHFKEVSYDVIHFSDFGGIGFYTAQAAALGQLSPDTAVITTLHGPSAWSRASNRVGVSSMEVLVRDAMERGTVEYSDAVISPSQHMLDWARRRGWSVPTHFHAFYALPTATVARRPSRPRFVDPAASPLELVFFGRIEQRKGCNLFIDAVNELRDRGLGDRITVTFLGKFNEQSFPPRLLGLRAQHWPIRWRVIDDLDSSKAIAYLAETDNRIAILPSLDDNSPCAVTECLLVGIPFLATNVGGIPEVVAVDARERVLVSPDCHALANAIQGILENGLKSATPFETQAESAARLARLHEEILAAKTTAPLRHELASGASGTESARKLGRPSSSEDGCPAVSVCVVHRNRLDLLKQALDGYERQEFRDFEVIVADNGSRKETLGSLKALERNNTYSFPIRVLELGANYYPERARNAAAAIAKGALLKFHDDDNVPKPNELHVLVEAMASGRADAVSCGLDVFEGGEPPDQGTALSGRVAFLGDGGAASYLDNIMGDTNYIIDRGVFEAIGGYTEDGFLTHAEDWRFLAKLKANGYRVASVPDPLIWYRYDSLHAQLNWRKSDLPADRARALEELCASLPDEVRQLVSLAQTQRRRADD